MTMTRTFRGDLSSMSWDFLWSACCDQPEYQIWSLCLHPLWRKGDTKSRKWGGLW